MTLLCVLHFPPLTQSVSLYNLYCRATRSLVAASGVTAGKLKHAAPEWKPEDPQGEG